VQKAGTAVCRDWKGKERGGGEWESEKLSRNSRSPSFSLYLLHFRCPVLFPAAGNPNCKQTTDCFRMAMGSVATVGNTYEEARKQRVEENRKRFKDLGISDLSKSLSKTSNSPNPKQRHPKPRSKSDNVSEGIQPRRSSRSRTQVTSYVDDFQADLDLYPKRRRGGRGSRLNPSWTDYLARPLEEVVIASYEERERARKAAEQFEKTLPSCHPTFVKSMVRSHVYSCFWLGLPSRFCKKILPKWDSTLILEHESGSTQETTYLAKRTGLSGGWRAFAIEYKLNDGDALVFQLVEPERFKVYIFRTSSVSAGENPNADAKKNTRATETEVVPPSQKRQKVKEDKKNEENDDPADGEESQPKARRGTGRRTVVKNQMKANGFAVKPHNDQQDAQEHVKKNDEKEKGADGEEHQTEARGRNSGRRSKLADESKEMVLAILAPIEKQGLAGKDEKETLEAAVGDKPGKRVIKPRKKPAPRLFRRKVFRD
ncbi:unnamed protein product, partial [Linum tenue]